MPCRPLPVALTLHQAVRRSSDDLLSLILLLSRSLIFSLHLHACDLEIDIQRTGRKEDVWQAFSNPTRRYQVDVCVKTKDSLNHDDQYSNTGFCQSTGGTNSTFCHLGTFWKWEGRFSDANRQLNYSTEGKFQREPSWAAQQPTDEITIKKGQLKHAALQFWCS